MARFAHGRSVCALAVWACAGVALLGCSSFSKPEGSAPELPAARLPSDAVVLEVTTVTAPADIEQFEYLIWKHVDEQHLALEVRGRLSENGLRCGLLGPQTPVEINRLFQEASREIQGDAGATPTANLETPTAASAGGPSRKRLQNRAGRRGIILLGGRSGELSVLVNEQGRIGGRTFKEAHCIFSVRSFPQGNGRVRVEVTPEIEYGKPQNQYVGRNGRIEFQIGRRRQIYDDLTCIATLAPGQMLLFSTTPQPKGLGQNMFTRETSSGPRKRFCIIRLVQTQYDDLFAKERITSPIVTSME